MSKRYLILHGKHVRFQSRLYLGSPWPCLVNMIALQWFGLRLRYEVRERFAVARVAVTGIEFAWPLTGWHWSWRREILIPYAIALVLWSLVAWWVIGLTER